MLYSPSQPDWVPFPFAGEDADGRTGGEFVTDAGTLVYGQVIVVHCRTCGRAGIVALRSV